MKSFLVVRPADGAGLGRERLSNNVVDKDYGW